MTRPRLLIISGAFVVFCFFLLGFATFSWTSARRLIDKNTSAGLETQENDLFKNAQRNLNQLEASTLAVNPLEGPVTDLSATGSINGAAVEHERSLTMNEWDARNRQLKAELETLKSLLESQEIELDKRAKHDQALQSTIKELQESLSIATAVGSNSIRPIWAQVEDEEERFDDLAKPIIMADAEIQTLKAGLEERSSKINELNAKLEGIQNAEAELQQVRSQLEERSKAVSAKEVEMAELVRRINELEEHLRNKSSDAERLQGERDTKEHETNSLKEELNNIRQELDAARKRISEMDELIVHRGNHNQELDNQIKAKDETIQSLQAAKEECDRKQGSILELMKSATATRKTLRLLK